MLASQLAHAFALVALKHNLTQMHDRVPALAHGDDAGDSPTEEKSDKGRESTPADVALSVLPDEMAPGKRGRLKTDTRGAGGHLGRELGKDLALVGFNCLSLVICICVAGAAAGSHVQMALVWSLFGVLLVVHVVEGFFSAPWSFLRQVCTLMCVCVCTDIYARESVQARAAALA